MRVGTSATIVNHFINVALFNNKSRPASRKQGFAPLTMHQQILRPLARYGFILWPGRVAPVMRGIRSFDTDSLIVPT